MTRTGLQTITDALKLLGVVAGHEVPTSAEAQDALARLNELIDSWGTHAQTLYRPIRQLLPLVAAKATYTIGPGGDVAVTPMPITLDAVSVQSATAVPVETFLTLASDQAYTQQPTKTLPGTLPQIVRYTRGAPLGALDVWPVPSAASTVVLYWREPVKQFPDLTTPLDLLPGYAKALRTNLALELAPEFGRAVDPLLVKLAAESLADVKRANLPYVEIGMDAALTAGGGYDIRSDG